MLMFVPASKKPVIKINVLQAGLLHPKRLQVEGWRLLLVRAEQMLWLHRRALIDETQLTRELGLTCICLYVNISTVYMSYNDIL